MYLGTSHFNHPVTPLCVCLWVVYVYLFVYVWDGPTDTHSVDPTLWVDVNAGFSVLKNNL